MEIRFLDADGFERHTDRADTVVVQFTRSEIEAGSVGGAVERLLALSDNAQHVRHYVGRVVLMFEGYDADPRELAEIPECVRFFRAVDQQWNYWLHFLMPHPDVLNVVFMLLLDVDVVDRDEGQRGFALKHPEQLSETLHRLFMAMNNLHEVYQIPQAINRSLTDAVVASLTGFA